MTEFFENGKIDNQIADRDSHPRLRLFRLENAEWKILNRKMRIFCDLNEPNEEACLSFNHEDHRGHEELF